MSALESILHAEPPAPMPTAAGPRPDSSNAPSDVMAPTSILQSQPERNETLVADKAITEDAVLDQAQTPDGTGNINSITTSVRRNASGSVSSVYSGNKIRHLKKEDGIPLWRKDIQYEFLKLILYDKTRCFTKQSDGTGGHTFADVYVDAMAKSSKCSKILKEKLLVDMEGAISMAMVCLLVNVGRMNTTLNFFPEMRAQLRTYHSIPALQARQDPNAYKQLQDAPRLKSILKGATEDEPQPSTLDDVKLASKPRTNPVNLIFILAQFAPKISETHFVAPRDFYDLVMRPTLSSTSRARAFLWLIWWYLESDFSLADTQRNPFGAGQYGEGEEGTGVLPLKVPTLESLTEEQAALENIDTDDEQLFGEVKRKERIAILASEPSPAMTALTRARKEKGLGQGYKSEDEGSESGWWKNGDTKSVTSAMQHAYGPENDSTHTRTPSPVPGRISDAKPTAAMPSDMRITTLLNDEETPSRASSPLPTPQASSKKGPGPGRGNWRRTKNKDSDEPHAARSISREASHQVPLLPSTPYGFVSQRVEPAKPTPGLPGPSTNPSAPAQPSRTSFGTFPSPVARTDQHVPTPSYQAQKRNRGVTQHQSALINHRKQQIEYTLDRRIRQVHHRAREVREDEGAIFRTWKRIRLMPVEYDSEVEGIKIRKAREKGEKDEDLRKMEGKGGDEVEAKKPRVLMAGFVPSEGENVDLGEEVKSVGSSLRRCRRRLERWESSGMMAMAVGNARRRWQDGAIERDRGRGRRRLDLDADGVEYAESGARRGAQSGVAGRGHAHGFAAHTGGGHTNGALKGTEGHHDDEQVYADYAEMSEDDEDDEMVDEE
nr:hypothetical protein B0A51_13424 [Rachicladosporium sp. CCFEE 5018]